MVGHVRYPTAFGRPKDADIITLEQSPMDPTPTTLTTLPPAPPAIPPIDFDRESIEQALRQTPAQRMRAGADLFDAACRVTLAGIRCQHPGISAADALDELRRRLELARKLEENR
jgi:hypothetical protein